MEQRLRFDTFELDLRTRELRKDGSLVKLQDQPMQLLVLLASHPGELVTRTEIEKALWGDGEFVEFEHAINTAMRKIRDALGDGLDHPRFIETLPRKGYRFIARVDFGQQAAPAGPHPAGPSEFRVPHPLARTLFLAVQTGYLAMYAAALYLMEKVDEVLDHVLQVPASIGVPLIIAAALCGIAVRLYLMASIALGHPAAGAKFRRLFPALVVLDIFWAASPLLLVRRLGYGLALGCMAALAYLPFSQRTLMQSMDPEGRP